VSLRESRVRILLGLVVLVAAGFAAWLLLRDDAGDPAADLAAEDALPGDPDRVPLEGFDEVAVRVQPAGAGEVLAWCLLAALTPAARGQGLMGVTDLQGYSGMAFPHDQDVENAFHMLNTPTPLSIAWIAADGAVVDTADMAPCEGGSVCPSYPPAGPYRTAIEVFQGDLPELGITPDATVAIGGECAPRQ
jgi:uncharacterized membrane protein (UPF0127 family)